MNTGNAADTDTFCPASFSATDHADSEANAVAYPNMALVKYWGKRDESLVLPVTGSLSMTLDIFPTTTRVSLEPQSSADSVWFDGRPAPRHIRDRVERFLALVRERAGRSEHARVETTNTVPTGTGLASSASGFAALAAAATHAYGLRSTPRDLSRLARRGSGSACRSIFGGFVIWHAGAGFGADGDDTSYAEPLPAGPDAALVIAIVDTAPKTPSSRTAMRQSMTTSPLYLPWACASRADLLEMCVAVADSDVARVGRIAEGNALGMHAVLLSARPAIRYLSPLSLRVLDRVEQLRSAGVPAYATIDAGPNVAVWCARSDEQRVVAALHEIEELLSVRVAHPGPGVTVTSSGRS
ncbi:diphosphomevalonate decarboxylase [Nocardia pseudobrasiliensis]|uniref:diphosphomevalonate decarboxylase n=1 Tax=Nocardia pseudobrasiliensis TaxID=45979 RepID=A0A370HKA0_9NOCA|nr:diphosphomevalonate decarboxylase [Nocardia pseudobrasiliensis]